MQIKKNPKARLENYSKLFALIGLVLALFIVHLLLEVKSYDDSLRDTLGNVTMVDEDKEDIPIIERQEIPIPKNTPPPPIPEKIEVIKDDLDIAFYDIIGSQAHTLMLFQNNIITKI